MKRILHVFALLLVFFCSRTSAEEVESTLLEFVRDNKFIELDSSLSNELIKDILILVEGTGYDSTKEYASEEKWKEWAEGTYFLIKFEQPTEVKINWKRNVVAKEILIPLTHEGAFILRSDTQYWSCTKYLPERFVKLVCREELNLKMYKRFCEDMSKWLSKKTLEAN